MKKSELEPPPRLPVKLDTTTNGEYLPRPHDPRLLHAKEEVLREAGPRARRLGLTRREYLASTAGAAGVFLALNSLGCNGGRYAVAPEAALDEEAARAALAGEELVVDVQTHAVSADRPWWETGAPNAGSFLRRIPQAACGASSWVRCYTDDVLVREVFLDSDTSMAVLSALWGSPHPLEADEAARTREQVAKLGGRGRLRIHGLLQPNEAPLAAVKEEMQRLAEEVKVDAWKLYPLWGPEGRGWWLTDPLGHEVVAHGLSLGVKRFAVHKGLPLAGMDPAYASPRDVGAIARAFPEATFLVYHAGWETDRREGPYDPSATRGVDALLRSLEESGIGGDGNVYAELGSTWRELMKRPDEAAHVLGKLLARLGEDRILWGTDAIWFGSPQDQIQAFRAFELTPAYQERYGYPALTKERKAKIFGGNAVRVYGIEEAELRRLAGDGVARAKAAYAEAPRPSFRTYGPTTRREVLARLARGGGRPH